MIVAWKITEITDKYFYIVPVIKDEKSGEILDFFTTTIDDLTEEEEGNLICWGFFNQDKDLKFWIHAIRQIDMLEHDFEGLDYSEIREMAKKKNLLW